jgi:hypothetical protein
MTEQELEQKLVDMKRYDQVYDELDAQMQGLTWPEWGTVRDQRDTIGEAYCAIFDELSAQGYRIRWNGATDCYEAVCVSQPEVSKRQKRSQNA